jgi:hypothetical protein
MLALGEVPRLYEFISMRDFERPKLRGQAARDAFEDQMNDYQRLGFGRSRRWPKRGSGTSAATLWPNCLEAMVLVKPATGDPTVVLTEN